MKNILNFAKEYKKENYNNQIRTVIPDSKLHSIIELSKSISHLDGDVCEVGVWRGSVGIIFGEIFKDKNIYLFDTFEGIPFHDEKYDNFHKKGDFGKLDKNTSWGDLSSDVEEVKNTLSIYENIFIHQGIFPMETGDIVQNNKFCMVHIDVNIYESYKDCLEFFYPKMVKHGLILLDDYKVSSCSGATIAVDNFCKENNIELELHNDQFYFKKL